MGEAQQAAVAVLQGRLQVLEPDDLLAVHQLRAPPCLAPPGPVDQVRRGERVQLRSRHVVAHDEAHLVPGDVPSSWPASTDPAPRPDQHRSQGDREAPACPDPAPEAHPVQAAPQGCRCSIAERDHGLPHPRRLSSCRPADRSARRPSGRTTSQRSSGAEVTTDVPRLRWSVGTSWAVAVSRRWSARRVGPWPPATPAPRPRAGAPPRHGAPPGTRSHEGGVVPTGLR